MRGVIGIGRVSGDVVGGVGRRRKEGSMKGGDEDRIGLYGL